jgi:predicted DNA-binding transcriptional regulator AlpA
MATSVPEERLAITAKDIMAMFGICRKSVDNHEKAGVLPKHFNMGKICYWWKDEVLQRINESREAA